MKTQDYFTLITNQALSLLVSIKAKGIAEFTGWVGMYGCVRSFDIDLMPPTYEKANGFKIQFSLKLEDNSIKHNQSVIDELSLILENGIEGNALYKAHKEKDIQAKKLQLKKLQAELGE